MTPIYAELVTELDFDPEALSAPLDLDELLAASYSRAEA